MNPIELVWSQVKYNVAENNTEFKVFLIESLMGLHMQGKNSGETTVVTLTRRRKHVEY